MTRYSGIYVLFLSGQKDNNKKARKQAGFRFSGQHFSEQHFSEP